MSCEDRELDEVFIKVDELFERKVKLLRKKMKKYDAEAITDPKDIESIYHKLSVRIYELYSELRTSIETLEDDYE